MWTSASLRFDFFDDKLRLDAFELDVLGRHDLVGVLAGQPIRLLSCVVPNAASAAADNDRTFGWNVEVWHERQMAEPRLTFGVLLGYRF